MTVTDTTTRTCTSLDTDQVEEDFKLEPTWVEIHDQLFDGLNRLGIKRRQVRTLMSLFSELSKAVQRGRDYRRAYLDEDGVYRIPMTMTAHELLDTFMKDREPAAAGTLHELANRVFLPAGKTFIHDVTDYCVIEVSDI